MKGRIGRCNEMIVIVVHLDRKLGIHFIKATNNTVAIFSSCTIVIGLIYFHLKGRNAVPRMPRSHFSVSVYNRQGCYATDTYNLSLSLASLFWKLICLFF